MSLSRTNYPSELAFGGMWDIDRPLRQIQREMNRLMGDFFDQAHSGPAGEYMPRGAVAPRIDVRDTENSLLVHADLPGIPKKNVQITAKDGALVISGETDVEGEQQQGTALVRERFQGKFMRTVPLPDTADLDAVRAKFDNGVLEVEVPKKSISRGRAISID